VRLVGSVWFVLIVAVLMTACGGPAGGGGSSSGAGQEAQPSRTLVVAVRAESRSTPQIRWRGTNRGAWPGTAEYDRLVDTWETSLNRNERTQAVIQMNRILNADVVIINRYCKLNAQAFANGLTGPRLTDPDGSAEWNIHEWEFR
jgi:hypothetical protein